MFALNVSNHGEGLSTTITLGLIPGVSIEAYTWLRSPVRVITCVGIDGYSPIGPGNLYAPLGEAEVCF